MMPDFRGRVVFCSLTFLFLFSAFSFAVPTVIINEPTSTTYHNISVILNTTITDASLDACAYSLDNWATNTTFDCLSATMTASNGSNTVLIRANDTLGNINDSESVSFTVAPAVIDYSIPSTGGGVQDPYQYSPTITSIDYSIPSTGVWVGEPYSFNETVGVTSNAYSIPSTGVWVGEPYFFNETAGIEAGTYSIPSTGVWVREAFFFNETAGIGSAVYLIPSVGISVIIHEETACISGDDCAGIGNLCIDGLCRGLTSVDYGLKCSVDSTDYSASPYEWAKGGCTVASQAKKVQGTGTFDFPNLKKGARVFRAYFDPEPGNATYAYYYLTPVNPDDEFVNAQLVVIVEGPQRMIRGEVVE